MLRQIKVFVRYYVTYMCDIQCDIHAIFVFILQNLSTYSYYFSRLGVTKVPS